MKPLEQINQDRQAARQRRVTRALTLLARDATISTVADELGVAPSTVRAYRTDTDGSKARARAAARRSGRAAGHLRRRRRAETLRREIAQRDAAAVARGPSAARQSSRALAAALGVSASRIRDYRAQLNRSASTPNAQHRQG